MKTKDKIFIITTILFTLSGVFFYFASFYSGEISDSLLDSIIDFKISDMNYQFLSIQHLNLISQQNLQGQEIQIKGVSFQFCLNMAMNNYYGSTES